MNCRAITFIGVLCCVLYHPASAQEWPDLSSPAPAIGGGERDTVVIAAAENYAFVPPVPGAKANALAWYDYFHKTRGVPTGSILLRQDSQVTDTELLKLSRTAAGLAGEKSTLWFIFIGHGAPDKEGNDGLLVGIDAQQNADGIKERSAGINAIVKNLTATKAARIVVLVDACFSGRGQDGESLAKGLQPLVVARTGVPHDPRLVMMTAAKGDEFAGALTGENRPAYSYLALGALRGWAQQDKNGEITPAAINDYIAQAFRATLHGRTQTPVLSGNPETGLSKSAEEKGPDLGALAKKEAPRAFIPSSLSPLSKPEQPKTFNPTLAGGTGWRTLDIDSLEKLEKAIDIDKNDGIPPEEKMAAWRTLAAQSSGYKDMAGKRAEEWQDYMYKQSKATDAKRERRTTLEADWTKLNKLLTLKLIPEEDKISYSLAFIKTYGSDKNINPHIQKLLPYILKANISGRELVSVTWPLPIKTDPKNPVLTMLKKKADTGDPWCMAHYAIMIDPGLNFSGKGAGQDAAKKRAMTIGMAAASKLAPLAEGGDTFALELESALVEFFQTDKARSRQLLAKAAEKGNVSAQYSLGHRYLADKKYTDAKKWLLKAAEADYTDAMIALSDIYMEGLGTEKNADAAIKWLTNASELGNMQAGWKLISLYTEGNELVDKQPERTLEITEKLAGEEDALAQRNLGNRYAKGDGVEQNNEKAREWLLKAIDGGERGAMGDIAETYFNEGNYDKTLQWFRKADTEANALYMIGILLYGQDPQSAVSYLTQAGAGGCGYAQQLLGEMYFDGTGVEQNYTQTAFWWRKASLAGMGSKIGVLYEEGLGVEKNLGKAYAWYTISDKTSPAGPIPMRFTYFGTKGNCEKCLESNKDSLKRIAPQLSAGQIAKANKDIKEMVSESREVFAEGSRQKAELKKRIGFLWWE